MKTINSKQLRSNLEQTFDNVLSGQDVIVTYRTKKPIRITAALPDSANKKQLQGLAAFDSSPKKSIKFNKNTSIKELYNKSLEKKYGK